MNHYVTAGISEITTVWNVKGKMTAITISGRVKQLESTMERLLVTSNSPPTSLVVKMDAYMFMYQLHCILHSSVLIVISLPNSACCLEGYCHQDIFYVEMIQV